VPLKVIPATKIGKIMSVDNIIKTNNIDQACRWVLMSAYLYYHRAESVISDSDNDKLCSFLSENWDDVPNRYVPLLDPDFEGEEAVKTSTFQCEHNHHIEGGAIAWLKKTHNRTLCPILTMEN